MSIVYSGIISFGKDIRGKQKVIVTPEDGTDPVEFLIPKGKHISYQEGEKIEKGDYL